MNIYSELRFGRLVVDGMPCCPTESFEECLWLSNGYIVVTSMVDRRDTLSVPSSPSLQLLLLTQRLGGITAVVNKISKFIPFATKAHADVGLVL